MWLAYSIAMEASRFQGTLGKRLMGMRVVHDKMAGCFIVKTE